MMSERRRPDRTALSASKMTDPLHLEWLEADGLGGFASGTVNGIRTRRYHALLLTATTPPAGRMVLVNGVETALDLPGGETVVVSRQRYVPGVDTPARPLPLADFTPDPWPRWMVEVPDGKLT